MKKDFIYMYVYIKSDILYLPCAIIPNVELELKLS